MAVDEVFKGLNDANRRLLLDQLFARDGQTLTELSAHLPQMTRFGVMNHLKVLIESGLVTKVKVGRETHHYLNAVPIRMVHDRWIHKYLEDVAGALVDLKAGLERGGIDVSKPTHVYEAYIRCTPEAAWQAIVDGDQTVQYFFGTRVHSDWQPGRDVVYHDADGKVVADGEIVGVDAGQRVDMTFHARWDPELEAEGPVRMAWIVEPAGPMTKVRVEYHDLDPSCARYRDFSSGIPLIVSGLKTLLETGDPLGVG